MLRSLQLIEAYQQGDLLVLKDNPWLRHLALHRETNINLERIQSIEDLSKNLVLEYVERTLRILNSLELPEEDKAILEEVLVWSEVAKCGLPHQREKWMKQGINLFVHNIGSAQIYKAEMGGKKASELNEVITLLIFTHGLIGQYIRGEVPLEANRPLIDLINQNRISKEKLYSLLFNLNYCIIAAISMGLWQSVFIEVKQVISDIINGFFENEFSFKEKLRRLRTISSLNGENFDKVYQQYVVTHDLEKYFSRFLDGLDLWYVESALYDYSFEDFIKILLLACRQLDITKTRHLSFEKLMKDMYYQYEGKKTVNIYKKRIIEKYLRDYSIPEIINGISKSSLHLQDQILVHEHFDDTTFFTFRFSPAGEKLIDFCIEAEKSGLLYEKAIILLFDLFDLRKDTYDRFHNEQNYLMTMNSAIDHKKIILDYITGERILDVGPGGGSLLDLIEENYPDKKITGIDFSHNVIDALEKKKHLEGRGWNIIYGDALHLSDYVFKGSVDTIIFCSIIHELFSYIEFEGKKFNHQTIAAALKSAFEVIPPQGRIIIRDGIMTEPVSQKRIIKFLSDDGLHFLSRYAQDFKGRTIEFETINQNEVLMPVNDAMEFLYTYTWGEKSYAHEVNEQFGYFVPSEYQAFIQQILGEEAKIIEFRHFLQNGYSTALSSKIEFFNEEHVPVQLPDSTCLIVIEKKNLKSPGAKEK